jgi:hypothetical protein
VIPVVTAAIVLLAAYDVVILRHPIVTRIHDLAVPMTVVGAWVCWELIRPSSKAAGSPGISLRFGGGRGRDRSLHPGQRGDPRPHAGTGQGDAPVRRMAQNGRPCERRDGADDDLAVAVCSGPPVSCPRRSSTSRSARARRITC